MRSTLFALLALTACLRDLPRPDEPSAIEAYRHELEVRPHGPRAFQARQQLEFAEYESAKKAHTIFACRRYLEEFPDGSHATDIRARLGELRWAEAERDSSSAALRGFLADEPQSPHAPEAWSRLSRLQLESAIRDGTPAALRAWLEENPTAQGRERALAALDEADFKSGSGPEGMRAYLAAHEGGVHRAEAAAAISRAAIEEATLLEDLVQLRALAKAGSIEATRQESQLAYLRAAALLDEGRLAQLGRKGDRRASRDLRALHQSSAGALEAAAQQLFLPRATLDELPTEPLARADALRGWALSLDGARLPRLLAELASQRGWVALTALQSAVELLAGLPPPEARLRAERSLAQLRPHALDAPQLAQVALLERALGRKAEALADVRSAVARDGRSLVASYLALELEVETGEPAVRALAAQALFARAHELEEAHGQKASQGAPDALALHELCAGRRAAEKAALIAPELRESAEALGLRLLEAEQAHGQGLPACDAEAESFRAEYARRASNRLAAALVLLRSNSPLARAALVRALERDPDPAIRAAATKSARRTGAVGALD